MPRPGIQDVLARDVRVADVMHGTKEVVVSTAPPVTHYGSTRTVAVKLYNHKRGTFRWAVWNRDTRVGILQRIEGATLVWEDDKPQVELATCGHCGRSWNDAAVSSITPTPAARCPFEYEHEYDDA